MAIRDVFKVSRKTFFNPTEWFGYQDFKEQTQTIGEVVRSVTTVPQPERTESYEEALKRLHMTDDEAQLAASYYRYYALGFFALAFFALIYSFYLLISHSSYAGCLLGLGVVALLGGQVFKYDFWAFQLRKRTLGLTFKDWKRGLFSQKDESA